MATQDQNQNKPNTNPNPNQGNQSSSQSNPQQSEQQDRGLEQNDHTYEGENDVTHAPKETGEPQNQGSSDALRGQSKFTPADEAGKQDQGARAGYAQAEHDKTPEENARDTNDSDPRESDDPAKGSL